MKSLSSWLIGIAFGATLFLGAQRAKGQSDGVPRSIMYQGLLLNNGVPFTGNVTLDFYFSDASGTTLYRQTLSGVAMSDGIINVLLGDPSLGGFPASMTFNEQYEMTIVVDNTTTLPTQLLWSAPYALNSERVGGISVSATPVNGDLFPMPLNGAGKISPTMLPQIPNSLLQTASIISINGTVTPDSSGNLTIAGAGGITVSNSSNTITISESLSGGQITGVFADSGLDFTERISGYAEYLYLGIEIGGVTGSMFAPNIQIPSLDVGGSSSASSAVVAVASEANGNEAMMVKGGISADNPTGLADGTGLTSGSSQTFWADQVSVPAGTGTSLQIYNKLVSTGSTIVFIPYGLSASVGQLAITSQGAGTFTVSSTSTMGTSGGGSVTGLNYVVINH